MLSFLKRLTRSRRVHPTPNRSNNRSSRRSPNRSQNSRVNLIDLHNTREIVKQTNDFAEMTENTDIGRLVIVHNLTAESILHELTIGDKDSHWAWWVFPSEKEGFSDPLTTRVTVKTYHQFLRNIDLDLWQKILKLIAEHPEKIPPIDHGRIHHFCIFWKNPALTHIPRWLKEVIVKLERYF